MTKKRSLQDQICERIALGESLRAICADAGMPSKSTVFAWLTADPKFQASYALARAFQAEGYADEIIDIADTPEVGIKTVTKEDGSVETTEGDMIDHRRLRIDTRKWMAAKLAPKKYGDSTALRLASDANRIGGDTAEIFVRMLTIAKTASERKIK